MDTKENSGQKWVVYSTLPADVIYNIFDDKKVEGLQLVTEKKRIQINGGANIADTHFITPKGVATVIDERDVETLKKNAHFMAHEKDGFVKVEKCTYIEPEKAAQTMEAKDKSAPKTPEDFERKKR
jgi:hypothetical protein